MNHQELGVRRVCQNCQTRFYDLKRKPITCPKCQSTFDLGALYKPKRGKANAKEAAAAPIFDPLEEIVFETDIVESEDADVLIEDPDDLGTEEEDVVGSLDHHDEKDNT